MVSRLAFLFLGVAKNVRRGISLVIMQGGEGKVRYVC